MDSALWPSAHPVPERRSGMPSRLLAALCCLCLLLAGLSRQALADPLAALRHRGVIVIGVKADYPLFGQVGANGQVEGFEVDIARALAEQLGLRAEITVVTSANRLQRLEDGTVDLVIATLGDTDQRRRVATLMEPNYYASGVNLMVPPQSTIRSWAELRGRPVCATQGAYFNRIIAERYLVDLQIFGNNRDARLAVRAGRCVGWLYDDTAIASDLVTPEWTGWKMPLASALVTPWALALPRAARGTELQYVIEDIIGEWHRNSFLIWTERQWGIAPSDFLRRAQEIWLAKDEDGQFVCRRGANRQWPDACRNRALLISDDVTGLMRLGLLVKERTGLDFSMVYDRYDRDSFLLGLVRTLLLVVGSMAGALLVGVAGALAVERRVPVVTQALQVLLTVLRMTPPLLQIYVVFFGIGFWLADRWGLVIDPMLTALACLSAYAGAAVAQALLDASGAIRERVPDFRLHPASLGRAVHAARAGIVGILVNIAKATGIASVIAVPEIINASNAIMAERGNAIVVMNVLMATYLLIVLGAVILLGRLQRMLERQAAPEGR